MPTTSVIEVEEEAPKTLDDLTHFWLENGAPCFIGNVKNICDHAEKLGFQVYYVLSEEKLTYEDGNTPKTVYRPMMFKVVNNIVGRAITPQPNAVKLETMERTAWFSLPKIPWTLVETIDAFFRHIDDKFGTESIVLLTYDSTKEGPEGWDVLVPVQDNTAHDCHYEADSVADMKPDHVYIVGSAHSHPRMAAYASGTDHKDQAEFDGLHITYGWLASKGNKTEYHIELQMGGESFVYKPEQIFEEAPKPQLDTSHVEAWAEKVSKKSYSTTNSSSGGTSRQNWGGSGGGANPLYSKTTEQSRVKPPEGCPDITKNVVIGVIGSDEPSCPFCEFMFVPADTAGRKCLTCHQYVCYAGESIDDVVRIRNEAGVYSQDIIVDREPKPTKPIFIWTREEDGTNTYTEVYNPLGLDPAGK